MFKKKLMPIKTCLFISLKNNNRKQLNYQSKRLIIKLFALISLFLLFKSSSQNCSKGCLHCDQRTYTCKVCDNHLFYFLRENSYCVHSPIPNCQLSFSEGNCLLCGNNHSPVKSGATRKCVKNEGNFKIPQCQFFYSRNKCAKCQDGFYVFRDFLGKDSCLKNTPFLSENCDIGGEKGCASCKSGFLAVKDNFSNLFCAKDPLPVSNCISKNLFFNCEASKCWIKDFTKINLHMAMQKAIESKNFFLVRSILKLTSFKFLNLLYNSRFLKYFLETQGGLPDHKNIDYILNPWANQTTDLTKIIPGYFSISQLLFPYCESLGSKGKCSSCIAGYQLNQLGRCQFQAHGHFSNSESIQNHLTSRGINYGRILQQTLEAKDLENISGTLPPIEHKQIKRYLLLGPTGEKVLFPNYKYYVLPAVYIHPSLPTISRIYFIFFFDEKINMAVLNNPHKLEVKELINNIFDLDFTNIAAFCDIVQLLEDDESPIPTCLKCKNTVDFILSPFDLLRRKTLVCRERKQIIPFCDEYDPKENKCVKCQIEREVDSTGESCELIEKSSDFKDDGCMILINQSCVACKSAFYLGDSGKCLAVQTPIPFCRFYKREGVCTSCQREFKLENGKCLGSQNLDNHNVNLNRNRDDFNNFPSQPQEQENSFSRKTKNSRNSVPPNLSIQANSPSSSLLCGLCQPTFSFSTESNSCVKMRTQGCFVSSQNGSNPYDSACLLCAPGFFQDSNGNCRISTGDLR